MLPQIKYNKSKKIKAIFITIPVSSLIVASIVPTLPNIQNTKMNNKIS